MDRENKIKAYKIKINEEISKTIQEIEDLKYPYSHYKKYLNRLFNRILNSDINKLKCLIDKSHCSTFVIHAKSFKIASRKKILDILYQKKDVLISEITKSQISFEELSEQIDKLYQKNKELINNQLDLEKYIDYNLIMEYKKIKEKYEKDSFGKKTIEKFINFILMYFYQIPSIVRMINSYQIQNDQIKQFLNLNKLDLLENDTIDLFRIFYFYYKFDNFHDEFINHFDTIIRDDQTKKKKEVESSPYFKHRKNNTWDDIYIYSRMDFKIIVYKTIDGYHSFKLTPRLNKTLIICLKQGMVEGILSNRERTNVCDLNRFFKKFFNINENPIKWNKKQKNYSVKFHYKEIQHYIDSKTVLESDTDIDFNKIPDLNTKTEEE